MPLFRVSFRSTKPDEIIEADAVRGTSSTYELIRKITVIGRPRTVVVRRIPRMEVDRIVAGPVAVAP